MDGGLLLNAKRKVHGQNLATPNGVIAGRQDTRLGLSAGFETERKRRPAVPVGPMSPSSQSRAVAKESGRLAIVAGNDALALPCFAFSASNGRPRALAAISATIVITFAACSPPITATRARSATRTGSARPNAPARTCRSGRRADCRSCSVSFGTLAFVTALDHLRAVLDDAPSYSTSTPTRYPVVFCRKTIGTPA